MARAGVTIGTGYVLCQRCRDLVTVRLVSKPGPCPSCSGDHDWMDLTDPDWALASRWGHGHLGPLTLVLTSSQTVWFYDVINPPQPGGTP